MNHRCFRLVLSRRLGMLVPVGENASAPRGRRRARVAAAAAALLVAGAGANDLTVPAGTLPIPVLPVDSANIAASGAATAAINAATRTMTVDQATLRAVIDWQQFNVGAGATVQFNHQQGAGSATLNRILDANPSVIQGAIRAAGEVYLINQNGILFKDGAQVDVGSLIASSLQIRDEAFARGFLSLPIGAAAQAAFEWGGSKAQFETSFLKVEAGAALNASTGGRVMLLAPKVENAGTISAPQGQAVLAGGAKVFLTAPLDATLRGFLVEVDPYQTFDAGGQAVDVTGGSVTNATTGRVLADRGNATLAAFAVNQNGRVTATTSVNQNGSIYLQARDQVSLVQGVSTVTVNGNVLIPRGQRTGTVTFGRDSVTEVLPQAGDATTTQDAQGFTPSLIDVVGRRVNLEANSLLRAPAGNVSISAQTAPVFQFPGSPAAGDVRIHAAPGARIDVSGTEGVELSVARNFVEVELRGNELRDSPLLRDSFVRGQKVTIDIRKGTPLADVSGFVNQVGRTVAERTAVGGSITLRSEGDVVLVQGSALDVSGSTVRYTEARVAETRLLGADGRIHAMSEATADQLYIGFADRSPEQDPVNGRATGALAAHAAEKPMEAGYVEGRDAGSITVVSHRTVLDGTLAGRATAGEWQRTQATAPRGGQIILGDVSAEAVSAGDGKLRDLAFVAAPTRLPTSFAADGVLDTPWSERTQLDPAALFSTGGFTRFSANANGVVSVAPDAPLRLAPWGSLSLAGRSVQVGGDIVVPGGNVALTTRAVAGEPTTDPARFGITVSDRVRVDVAGLWVNDRSQLNPRRPDTPLAVDAGRIELRSEGDVMLGLGSVLDVSAGARVDGRGNLSAGDAGSIRLDSGRIGIGDADRQVSSVILGGELRGFGIAQPRLGERGAGGSLRLSTSSVRISGPASGQPGELLLDAGFFDRGGFTSFLVNGQDGLEVSAGATVSPAAMARLIEGTSLSGRRTGARLEEFATAWTPQGADRPATQVSLHSDSSVFGNVQIQAGAMVRADPGGSITLESGRRVTVLGTLDAPAGTIIVRNTPPGSNDTFEGDVSVWIGSTARLFAQGRAVSQRDLVGRHLGEVLDGGRIEFQAAKGSLVLAAGSRLDVSGVVAGRPTQSATGAIRTEDRIDLPVLSPLGIVTYRNNAAVAGNAGEIVLAAREGMFVDGTLAASAGRAAGVDAAGTAGGTLRVAMLAAPQLNFPGTSKNVVISAASGIEGAASFLPPGTDPGDLIPVRVGSTDVQGNAYLSTAGLDAAGFDSIELAARDRILLAGNATLEVDRALHLFSPEIAVGNGGSALLRGASVILGNADPLLQTNVTPTGGIGSLEVRARVLDLVGRVAISGVDQLTLGSSGLAAQGGRPGLPGGDVRLRGVVIDTEPGEGIANRLVGGLTTAASRVDIVAERVAPTSASNYTLRSIDAASGATAGTIAFSFPASRGADQPVLSAAGSLTVQARDILQDARLLAPFGSIRLEALGSVVLGASSETSVSGAGLSVPFGRTELSGKDWVYALGSGFGNQVFDALPEKRVDLSAPDVRLLSETRDGTTRRALVALGGGGELLANEFVPGPGGSRDILDPLVSPGSFAILPGVGAGYGPVDHQSLLGLAGWRVGDQVQLRGIPGLADGAYTLLPPAYAALPGAYLVTPRDGPRDLPEGVFAPRYPGPVTGPLAGVQLVAASRSSFTYDGAVVRDERTSFFEVEPASAVAARAEYSRMAGSDFFARVDGAGVPGDAGRLALSTTGALQLDGRIDGIAQTGRRGLQVDIAAPVIRVRSTDDAPAGGGLDLEVSRLNALNAASLLLGGTRSRSGQRVALATGATGSIVLANRADDPLRAAELMLVSPGNITLEAGAAVVAVGAGVEAVDAVALSGNGAFVRVANAPAAIVDRSAFDGSAGQLRLGAGSRLESAGSLILDATLSTVLDASVDLTSPAISLAAGRIDLGANAPASPDGLILGAGLLDRLGAGAALALRGYAGIDVHGAATIGAVDAQGRPQLAALTLDAPAITVRGAGERIFRAAALTVRNSGGEAVGADGTGSGTLRLEALTTGATSGGTLLLGPGAVRISGVNALALQADRELRFAGNAGLDARVGTLSVTTPQVSGDTAAALELANTSGAVVLAAPAVDPGGRAASGLGARLVVAGQRVDVGTRVLLPSGHVSVTALGAAPEDAVRMLSGARIDVAGVPVVFTAGVSRSSDGGTVTLSSAVGDVALAGGARVDVSAGGADARGGRLAMRAGRSLVLEGQLLGGGGASIEADVGSPGDVGAFGAAATSGGFTGGLAWRQRSGDIAIANDQSLTARVIRLSADAGQIDVAGRLDARAPVAGRIELWAAGDVSLTSGGKLLAAASGTGVRGGDVTLGTSGGVLRLETGSAVDVSGPGGAGQLWLRAPRVGNDVAIAALATSLTGTDAVVIEAVRVYAAGTLGTAGGSALNVSNTGASATLFNDTIAYIAAARPAIDARLGQAGGPSLRVRPGIEVQGDAVTLASDWNLFCGTAATCAGTEGVWSPGGEPGVLTLRAAGSLTLNGTLNDGFRALPPANLATATAVQMNDAFIPRSGGGWSYRLVAGADGTAADPLATVTGAGADVTLAAGRLVRTSDGFIDVAAARDVVLGNARSVMYTAGEPAPTVAGFVVPTPPSPPSGQPRAHTPTYTEGGGDVRLVAGRDVRGTASGQSVTEWLYRDVRRNALGAIQPNPQTTWWVRFDAFQQGVGALGGGDVALVAGRDIVNVAGAVPTNARLGGELSAPPSAANFVQLGGGDLLVAAGRDILGGQYLVQRGSGDIRAGRDLASGTTVSDQPLHTLFALGDASLTVRAGRTATVEGVFNPTIQRQPRGNIGTTGLLTSYFLTYSPTASFDLGTLTGDATLSNQRDLLSQISGSPLAGTPAESAAAVIYPGTVKVASLSGDVRVAREFFMAPASRGQLELLARDDVTVGGRILMSDVSVLSLPSTLSPDRIYTNAIEPLIVQAAEQGAVFHDEGILHAGDAEPVRIVAARGDIRGPVDDVSGISPLGVFPKALTFVAGRDILDTWIIGQNTNPLDVTRIEAGRDLRFNTLRDPLGNQRTNLGGIQWGGSGEVQVSTGRDVDLGNSQGIVTVGNIDNPFLPEAGADIRVSTGAVAPDYTAFLDAHLDTDVDRLAARFPWVVRQRAYEITGNPEPDTPEGVAKALTTLKGAGDAEVAAFVESVSYRTELTTYMRTRTRDAALDTATALQRFRALDRASQTEFVNAVLFEEIRLAGNPGDPKKTYLPGADVRGYRALSALYPVEPEVRAALTESNFAALVQLIGERYRKNVKPLLAEMAASTAPLDPADGARAFARNALALSERYAGDVSLFFSQIKTQQGGDIELRVPGGLINAGLANPGRITKGASDLGIVTVRGGSVQAAVLEDFLVNQSRVFTLGGGDIRLWSSFGNIDAGKGAKTASATPPPQIVIRDGKFVLDTSRSVEGSGIGVLLSRSDVPPGNSELITPLGEVDAGDAGIRVAGNLIVRAQTVANATNVNVGGASSGVPAASASLSVGITGASSVDSQTSQAVAKAAESAASSAAAKPVTRLPSFITVEVLGIGEEGR